MSLVTIKGYPSGIALHLDPDADFDKVLQQIEEKFESSRKFFKNANVALSINDRIIDDNEEKLIVQAINEHSDLNVMCIVGRNPETNRKFVKALKRVECQGDGNNARIYMGNVDSGEIVESEGSLIVIGDVCKGAAIVAKEDCIVLGSIFGQAYAGNSGNNKCFIVTMQLEPEFLSIAGIKQAVKSKSVFGKKTKYCPTLIRLEDDKMIFDIINEDVIKEMIKAKNA